LLDVGVCCKSLSSQVLIKGPREREMVGKDVDIVGRVVHNVPTTASLPVLRLAYEMFAAQYHHIVGHGPLSVVHIT